MYKRQFLDWLSFNYENWIMSAAVSYLPPPSSSSHAFFCWRTNAVFLTSLPLPPLVLCLHFSAERRYCDWGVVTVVGECLLWLRGVYGTWREKLLPGFRMENLSVDGNWMTLCNRRPSLEFKMEILVLIEIEWHCAIGGHPLGSEWRLSVWMEIEWPTDTPQLEAVI